MSLHPATRRLLQGEVARTYAGKQSESRKPAGSSWDPLRLWPGLGWALAVLVGLVAAASLMLPQRGAGPYELAMQDSQMSFAKKLSSEPNAAPAPASSQAEAKNPAAKTRELPVDYRVAAANQPQPEPQSLLAYDAPGQKANIDNLATTAGKDTLARNEEKTAAPAAPVAVSAAPPPSNAGGSAIKGDGVRSDFAGEPPSASKALALTPSNGPLETRRARLKSEETPVTHTAQATANDQRQAVYRFAQAPSGSGGLLDKAVAPVLASFDFEQIGSQIRIVDADGSVYLGTIRPSSSLGVVTPAGTSAGRLLSDSSAKFNRITATAVSAAAEADKEAAALFTFQVEGTNQTLKQKVVVTGGLFGNAQNRDRKQTDVMTNAVVETAPSKPNLLRQPTVVKPVSRISATATVGGASFEINAVQTQ